MYKQKILVLTLLFVLVYISCEAQQTDNFTGTIKINGTIELGNTPQAITTKFGQPNSTETVFWEMKEVNITRYHYNGARFDFMNNELLRFTFTSSSYHVNLNSTTLKVGNNISTIATAFPNTYQYRVSEGTDIGLGTGDSQYLNIKTNSNGVITEIQLRFIP